MKINDVVRSKNLLTARGVPTSLQVGIIHNIIDMQEKYRNLSTWTKFYGDYDTTKIYCVLFDTPIANHRLDGNTLNYLAFPIEDLEVVG